MSSLPSSTPSLTTPSTPVSTPSATPSSTPSLTTPSSTSPPSSTPTSQSPSSTSSSTTPTSTSTPSSTSTTTPTSIPTLTPSQSQSTFTSVGADGSTIVYTSIVRSTSTPTGVVSSNSNSSKGFFQNTGAVAGTFSVVGLIGLGILIFLVTTVMRRRRADKFDKDVALAAAEAAATAHSPDFDDYGYSAGRHGVGGYGYADTYPQDPVQFPPTRETYGMSNVGANAYAEPDTHSVGTGGPGAAGIGAGDLYRAKSGKNQSDPFNAYAIPQGPTTQQQQPSLRYRNAGQDGWDEPTLTGGGYDVARSQLHPGPDGVVRSKSIQSNLAQSLSSHYSTDPLTQDPSQPPPVPESYLDHYRAGFDPQKHQPQTRPLSTASMSDAYGGVTTGNQPAVPEKFGVPSNPFESQTPGDRNSSSSDYSQGGNPVFAHDDSRMSLRDDEDYGARRRVLKVANE